MHNQIFYARACSLKAKSGRHSLYTCRSAASARRSAALHSCPHALLPDAQREIQCALTLDELSGSWARVQWKTETENLVLRWWLGVFGGATGDSRHHSTVKSPNYSRYMLQAHQQLVAEQNDCSTAPSAFADYSSDYKSSAGQASSTNTPRYMPSLPTTSLLPTLYTPIDRHVATHYQVIVARTPPAASRCGRGTPPRGRPSARSGRLRVAAGTPRPRDSSSRPSTAAAARDSQPRRGDKTSLRNC